MKRSIFWVLFYLSLPIFYIIKIIAIITIFFGAGQCTCENSAIKLADEKGCYGVICGHIHQPSNRMIGNNHYLNSGDWVENRTAIILNSNNEFIIYHFVEQTNEEKSTNI